MNRSTNGHGWGSAFADESAPEQVEIDGMHVVFDQKVGLHAANLQKKPSQPLPKRARGFGGRALRGSRHGRH